MDEIILKKDEKKKIRKAKKEFIKNISNDLTNMHIETNKIYGDILQNTITVENLIKEVILSYFIKDRLMKDIFSNLILDKEFFTFVQKIRVFKNINLDEF